MKFSIRQAESGESGRIRELLAMAFQPYEHLYHPEAYASTVIGEPEIEKRIEEGTVWVALADGIVAGTMSAILRKRGMYIRSMAVDPGFQGNGIGYKILEQAEKNSQSAGTTRLYLYTTPYLKNAIRLYEKFGFSRGSWPTPPFFGTPLIGFEKFITL